MSIYIIYYYIIQSYNLSFINFFQAVRNSYLKNIEPQIVQNSQPAIVSNIRYLKRLLSLATFPCFEKLSSINYTVLDTKFRWEFFSEFVFIALLLSRVVGGNESKGRGLASRPLIGQRANFYDFTRERAPEPRLGQTLTSRQKRSNKSTQKTQPVSADHQRNLPTRKENF